MSIWVGWRKYSSAVEREDEKVGDPVGAFSSRCGGVDSRLVRVLWRD